MTTNLAADSARIDPTGVFITGTTGLGKVDLAQTFASHAVESGATVQVIDVAAQGVNFPQQRKGTAQDLRSAVRTLRDLASQVDPRDPTVVVIDHLVETLHRDDRTRYADDQHKREADRWNRLRDELEDLITDLFNFGASSGVFPVVLAESEAAAPLITRVKAVTEGWVHFEFTGIGQGVLHVGRDKSPFVLPAAHCAV